MRRGPWLAVAAVLLGGALALRVAYVLAQPRVDPGFAHPGLDAAYYLDWARSIASGRSFLEGAFYLSPLYPYLLGGFFALFGERLVVVLLLQQVAMLLSAGLLGAVAARRGGPWAALATAALFLAYQPLLFFAARPLGEATSILLLALAVFLEGRGGTRAGLPAGLAVGGAALARPNLLLVPLGWALVGVTRRRLLRPALLLVGVAIVVLPVTLRNLAASGHAVPVSSNGGLTLYHGNGPGPLGIYNPPDGFSGDLARQREEATALARLRTGRQLDPVEADRYWGAEAVRARLADPIETAWLAVRRCLLLLDSYEHGLDEPPALDRNPWRLTLRIPFPGSVPGGAAPEIPLVPFGLLAGLALAGLRLRGAQGSGGAELWSAIGACVLTPWIFYVSSRYRMPVAALLCVPAGLGAVALVSPERPRRERGIAGILATACAVGSFLVPFPELRRAEEAAALSNRASAYQEGGDTAAAEREARTAVATEGGSTSARYTLALVLERSGRKREAEVEYGRVLQIDPGHAEAAGNLSRLLVEDGRGGEAIPILRQALVYRPGHVVCWTNLVVALAATGDLPGARAAAREAELAGAELGGELLRTIGVRNSGG